MNKLFPILLAVVLGGCGTSPDVKLEKCADVKFKDIMLWNFNKTQKKFLAMTLGEYLEYAEKNLSNTRGLSDEAYIGIKKMEEEKNEFYKKTLGQKLEYKRYTDMYKKCEIDKSKYPETFNAKWK
tara:strand:+ start:144 stop:518 length:375 start_codon:yes stop_codon:yes gene_type:complete